MIRWSYFDEQQKEGWFARILFRIPGYELLLELEAVGTAADGLLAARLAKGGSERETMIIRLPHISIFIYLMLLFAPLLRKFSELLINFEGI